MQHRFVSVFRRVSSVLLALGTIFLIASKMQAQDLQFTPGIAGTIVGDVTGSLGYSANNYTGPASALVLRNAYGINLDSAGNIYIASRGIVRVIAAGSTPIPAMPGVTVQAGNAYAFAGGGTVCSSSTDAHGNGCPATQATVSNTAEDMAVDAHGNVFIADRANEEIRVVYAGGTIPGLASPQPGYIYSLAAAAAYFTSIPDQPVDIAVDAQENIYFTNAFSSALSVIYSGQTAAGNPLGIPAGTPVGGVYTFNNSNCSGDQPVCGDGGSFAQAQLAQPVGVAVDSSGNLYFGDSGTGHLRVVYVAGNIPGLSNLTPGNVYTVAGGGTSQTIPAQGEPAISASGVNSGQIVFDAAGSLYLANGATATIEKVDASGTFTTVFGGSVNCAAATDADGDGCPATSATFVNPFGVAVDSGGNIYASDNQTHGLIRKSTVSSSAVSFAGTAGLPVASQIGIVSNAGAQPLQLSGLNFSGSFAQTPSGGSNDCTASTSLAPGASCVVAIALNNAAPGQVTGALNVASNSLNATGGNNTIALSGTIAQAATLTALTSNAPSPLILNAGQSVTFTVTVAPPAGNSLMPTGTVTLLSGSTQVGTGTLASGAATMQLSNLPAGNLFITAQYNGDTNFTGSTSTAVPVNVASASAPVAEVALAASPTIATTGQSIMLTATVTTPGGSPVTSGTITFQEGSNPLGAAAAVNGSGVAALTISTLPIGGNPLIAVFSGTTGYGANFSNSVTVTVNGGGEFSFTPGVIEKIAGVYPTIANGQYGQPDRGYSGDNVPAIGAALNSPGGVAADSFGNVYIADEANNRIRVIASGKGTIAGVPGAVAGNIYTFAGGGTCSPAPCGDGGQATQAALSGPENLVLDAFGNVYLTDGYNNGTEAVVRKVNSQGIIQTVAGNASLGIGYSGNGGPATSAQIGAGGIFVDNAGNLYIAEGGSINFGPPNNVIQRVDALTGVITTVAGTVQTGCPSAPCGDGQQATSAFLSSPSSVAVDAAGDLYIADSGDYVVRKVAAQTGIISTVAGSYTQSSTGIGAGDGGPATSAQFGLISSIAVDNANNLYIPDSDTVNGVPHASLREVNAQTGIITTIVGGGTCSPSPCGDGGLATSASLYNAPGLGLDSQGNLYLTDASFSIVREVPVTTTAINFGSENEGTNNTQTFTVTNIGAQPLNFSGISVANTSPTPGPSPSDFSQQPSGGADCTSNISLAAGGTCNIEVQWFPTIQGAETAAITVASNADNAVSGNNVITAGGSGIAIGGNTAQTITFPALPASVIYGQTIPLNATASSGLPISYRVSGPGTVNQTAGTLTMTGSGAITVTAYQFGNGQYAAATPVPQSTASTGGPTLTIAANNISVPQGSAIPALTYTINGLVNGDTTSGTPVLTTAGTQNSPIGNYPISIAQGSLTAPAAYDLSFVPGTLYITGTGSQTITFGPVGSVTYGAKPITLSATASSKLPVTFTVASGPGFITSSNTLTITGAGSIVVN
ncbi:Ig-like domain repeat protein, partial [Paracidobacterium acidisoli]